MTVRATGKPEGCKLIRVEAELETLPAGTAFSGSPSDGVADSAKGAVDRPLIARILIRGDFFAIPEEGFEKVEAALAGTPADSVAAAFDFLAQREGLELFGITGAAVAEVLGRALDAARVQTA